MHNELVRVMRQHKGTEGRQRPKSNLQQTALFLVPYIVRCNLSLSGETKEPSRGKTFLGPFIGVQWGTWE